METNRAFIVTVTVDTDALVYIEQLAADIQSDLLDSGHAVVQVKPWSNHADTSMGEQSPLNLGGGFPPF